MKLFHLLIYGAGLGWCVARSFVGTRNNWGSSFSRLKLSPNSGEFRVIGPLSRTDTRAGNEQRTFAKFEVSRLASCPKYDSQ